MATDVARWVRLGVAVAMGVPQLVIGLWALVAPERWFLSFPGFDPRLVAAEPPYNEHLARDVGAGFFATGVVLIVAAAWANRAAIQIALLGFAAFTVPHVTYHATKPADALTGIENAVNALTLASGLVLATVFAWGMRTSAASVGDASESAIATPPLVNR
ncbi:MAG: hypothetical protein H0W25_03930 [Acidimicrobiia bacterium]|nr:hypothetical protein [Acidimicrobiia bacterium]